MKLRGFLSMYSWRYPTVLVYMLQSTEYQVKPYLQWFSRTHNFSSVMYRRTLDKTKVARLLLLSLRIGMLAQLCIGLTLFWIGTSSSILVMLGGIMAAITYPMVWAYVVVVPLELGRWFVINPNYRRQVKAAEPIFANSKATKIAVAGSYGKTSMKELLKTVLSEGKVVAATPANKNVAISHARFAQKLTGKEEILVIEYGEGAPGDVARFTKNTHPDKGIITGLAPAHLDQYPSLAAAGKDIFSLAKYVGAENAYVNSDSSAIKDFIRSGMHGYSQHGVLGWRVSDIRLDFMGTKFTMKKGSHILKLHSGLLGRHQVGPLALVAALAMDLGLSARQVELGIGKTTAFEHRMQPRALRGAWILDDTYNGNIDGMKAGLKLLAELPAKRKTYVTPGLVDQGQETKNVHQELGKAIAEAKPDKVVLMHNSAAPIIEASLKEAGYRGELQIERQPLDFYTNLEHFLANGDVVMLQNDWTDNYN